MAKRKYYIDRFDRGIQQSARTKFEDRNVLGFVHCSHFDVFTDPTRLIPMAGFEDQRGTSNAADSFEFGGIGGNASKVYAQGKALAGWYQQNWDYRIEITPDAAYSGGTRFLTVDLSNMPAAFWSNVDTNGADIRVTSSDGETERAIMVRNFSVGSETGTLYFNTGNTLDTSYFIYYGNADADAYAYDDTYGSQNVFASIELAYSLDAVDEFYNVANIATYELTGSGNNFSAVSSPVGGGSSTLRHLNTSPTMGNNVTISFIINRGTTVGAPTILLNYRSGIQVTLRTDGKLSVFFDYTSGFATYVTTNAVPASTWIVVTVTVSGNDVDVYFDDTTEINQTAPENGNFDYSGTIFELYTLSGISHDMIVVDNTTWTAAAVATYANNLIDNSNFWSIDSEETLSAFSKSYDGFQLYEKAHSATDWSAVYASNDLAALDRDHSPSNIPILVSGSLVVFFTIDGSGNTWVNTFTTASGISMELQNLGVVGNRYPTFGVGADNIAYVGFGQKVYSVTDGSVSEVFDTGKDIWSLTPYRDILAITTEENERNIVETYDFARTDPISTLDFGSGEVMLIADLLGYLIGVSEQGVLDVFETGTSNDDTLPNGMSIVISSGGDGVEALFFPTQTKVDPTDDGRKPPIAQNAFKRKRSIIALGYFDDDTEKRGVWEIGMNSVGQLILNMLVALPSAYAIDHIWSSNNFLYFKDGGTNDERTYRLKNGDVTGDYTATSLFETTAIGVDNPSEKEQVKTVVVGAYARQGFTGSVVVKYKSNRTPTWTTIATITEFSNDGSDEVIRKVIKRTSSGGILPTFEEGQFRVESTGGIQITEFEVITETMSI